MGSEAGSVAALREDTSPSCDLAWKRTAGVHVASATVAADILVLEPATRPGAFGRAAAGLEHVVGRALAPLYSDLLRTQRAFNIELLYVLEAATGTERPPHDRVGGASAQGVTRSARGRVIGWLVERQQRWNATAFRAAALAARQARPPLREVHALLGELEALGRFPAAGGLTPAARASRAVWRAIFRRQATFNAEIQRALAALFELPRPGDDGGLLAYHDWLAPREDAWRAEAASRLPSLRTRPALSIIVPTYETPPSVLQACLDSVLAQTYDRWELCVADDGSRSPEVRRALAEYARSDDRVRVTFLPANRGIALATNAALDLATGDYVCFLDHDDRLAPFALAHVAIHLNDHPETDVLYSDEDRVDVHDTRFMPFMKPDWSPDMLRSGNYVCHFLVVRRRLLAEAGGLRPGFEGAQDFDLVLRLTERTDRVGHIPRILYHWRAGPTSTAARIENKPMASESGLKAVREHLGRCGADAEVDAPQPTQYRVRYRVSGRPTVSIVVAARPAIDLTRLRGGLAEATRYPRTELCVVGGEMADARERHLPWDGPFNATAMRNAGAREMRGDFLLFLHDDIEMIDPQWLDVLLGHAQRPGVGAVGAKLVYPDGTVQHAGLVVGLDGLVGRPFAHMADAGTWTTMGRVDWTRNYLAVSGACLLVQRIHLEAAGGFDEALPTRVADVELCLRLGRQGLRTVYAAEARLIHHGCDDEDTAAEAASGLALEPFTSRGDPFYNPNLSRRVGNGRLVGYAGSARS